jgi:hypothetical protein
MIANRAFENVVNIRCSGTTTVNQNCSQEEIKNSLLSGGACHHLVETCLFCHSVRMEML